LRDGIVRRGLLVDVDEALIEHLAAAGFHPLYGARPLQRTIERLVIAPLARLVVAESARPGQLLRLDLREGNVHLSLLPIEEETEQTPRPRRTKTPDPGTARDLRATCQLVAHLRQQLAEEMVAPMVERLQGEVASLLEQINGPTFWNEPTEARRVLTRVYELERVLKRL